MKAIELKKITFWQIISHNFLLKKKEKFFHSFLKFLLKTNIWRRKQRRSIEFKFCCILQTFKFDFLD